MSLQNGQYSILRTRLIKVLGDVSNSVAGVGTTVIFCFNFTKEMQKGFEWSLFRECGTFVDWKHQMHHPQNQRHHPPNPNMHIPYGNTPSQILTNSFMVISIQNRQIQIFKVSWNLLELTLRRGAYRDFHSHPLIAFHHLSIALYTKAFRCCNYNFKIGALKI